MSSKSLWLAYTIIIMLAWGVWGAFAGKPTENGFPAELSYVAWSITMIPFGIIAMYIAGWKIEHDGRSILLGCLAGFLGAAGQLILLPTLEGTPDYLVFALIAINPLVTIVMALVFSGERSSWKGAIGILIAIPAAVLLAWEPEKGAEAIGYGWVWLTLLIILCWGIQGFVISHANKSMKAESIFFYMVLSGLLLAPIALWMTDFNQEINWGLSGMWQALATHPLNALGALLLVYAFRYGKAIIVSPLVNAAAPVITVLLAIKLSGKIPTIEQKYGIGLAIVAALFMALEDSDDEEIGEETIEAIAKPANTQE